MCFVLFVISNYTIYFLSNRGFSDSLVADLEISDITTLCISRVSCSQLLGRENKGKQPNGIVIFFVLIILDFVAGSEARSDC